MDDMSGSGWMEPGASGDAWSPTTVGMPSQATGPLPGDLYEANRMEPFKPSVASERPWWEALVMYGATRAIDNRFGMPSIQGNTDPGSFAGQNGRTYSQNPSTGGVNRPQQGGGMAQAGMSPVMLLAIGGLALFALAH